MTTPAVADRYLIDQPLIEVDADLTPRPSMLPVNAIQRANLPVGTLAKVLLDLPTPESVWVEVVAAIGPGEYIVSLRSRPVAGVAIPGDQFRAAARHIQGVAR